MAKILVIDDEKTHRDLLRNVLSYHGHEVVTADGGEQGIELFKQRGPDFTLLDLRMPLMNGIETLKEIRAIDPHAAVLILTAWGTDQLEFQARQLGVMDFLNKNLALDNITEALEAAMQKPAKASAPSTEPTATAVAAQGVLVVDDDPQVRESLRDALTARGYAVQVAKDGHEALTLAQESSPKLLVLDLSMPGMNGVEVLRQLRGRHYNGVVILLTDGKDDKLMKEAMDLGSVDFMGKPVDVQRLELAIQMSLGLTGK